MIKFVVVSSLVLILSACSKSGSSSGSSVEGLNLTGTWNLLGIECYDSSLSASTAYGVVAAGSTTETNVISGNRTTSTYTSATACTVEMSRSFVANLTQGDSAGGYGTGTLGAATATVSPSPCALSLSFTMASGAVTPDPLNVSYTDGDSEAQQSFDFV